MQRVAAGLVLVLLDVSVDGWDVLADPVGWALVLAGVLPVTELLGGRVALTAVLAFVTSLVVYPPAVVRAVDPAVGWALSLPHLAFLVVLCLALAGRLPAYERRFRVTAVVLAVLGVAPVLVLGGGLLVLAGALAFAAVVTQLYVVYLLFRVADLVPGRGGDATRAAPERERPST
jgi:hypothetical protein